MSLIVYKFKYGLTFKHGFQKIPVHVGISYLIGKIVMGFREMILGRIYEGKNGNKFKIRRGSKK